MLDTPLQTVFFRSVFLQKLIESPFFFIHPFPKKVEILVKAGYFSWYFLFLDTGTCQAGVNPL